MERQGRVQTQIPFGDDNKRTDNDNGKETANTEADPYWMTTKRQTTAAAKCNCNGNDRDSSLRSE
jgi:hypothetical protein